MAPDVKTIFRHLSNSDFVNSTKYVYVNGNVVATQSSSGTLPTGQTNQFIGAYGPGTAYYFNGRMGCTNNPLVQHIFSDKLIFDIDIKECINKAIKFEQLSISERKEHILLLMEFVKLNHTYISRIQDLIQFITMFTDFVIADDWSLYQHYSNRE